MEYHSVPNLLEYPVERLISNGFRLLFKCFLSSRIDHSTRLDRFLGTLRHKWSTHYSKIAKYVKKSNQQKSVEYFIYHAKKLTFYLFSTHYFLPNLNLISLKQTISQWIITKIYFKRQKKGSHHISYNSYLIHSTIISHTLLNQPIYLIQNINSGCNISYIYDKLGSQGSYLIQFISRLV